MIRHIALATALILALSAKAQETLVPDSTLHLPELNSLGQMHAISRWPGSYGLMGYQNWDLHKGMNLSLGASVFTGFGKYAPSGAGFAQNASGMYAWPINDKLSFAAGVYLLNATWGGLNLRDTGLSGVLSYRFNERWEGYLYGQKSLRSSRQVQRHPVVLHPALSRRTQTTLIAFSFQHFFVYLQKITPNNSNDEEISLDCAGNMDCSSLYTTKAEEDSRRSDTMT